MNMPGFYEHHPLVNTVDTLKAFCVLSNIMDLFFSNKNLYSMVSIYVVRMLLFGSLYRNHTVSSDTIVKALFYSGEKDSSVTLDETLS